MCAVNTDPETRSHLWVAVWVGGYMSAVNTMTVKPGHTENESRSLSVCVS